MGRIVGESEQRSGPACRAPQVTMHFSVAGNVHACCANGTYSYGDATMKPLVDIWEGARRRAMADDLSNGHYPVGCEGCAIEHGLGNRRSTPASAYDDYLEGSPAWPRQLEFTLSNRCNLACIQCNGDNSSTIRAQREGRPPMPMPYGDGF
ncbi:MAG: SPASM domain-containing protein, partial [Acidimicrobiales bacterium]|nr:SPASM domain-containing protein [Acidimicrobiales bacterium]